MSKPCSDTATAEQRIEEMIGQGNSILTPELIKILLENYDIIKKMLKDSSEADESARLKNFKKVVCCCPEFLKFKIFLSNVWIINQNAACPFTNEEGRLR